MTKDLLLKDWDNWPEEVKKLIDRDGRQIPEYEQGAPIRPTDRRLKENRAGRPAKYPWDEWMDGKTHVVTMGTDFDSEPKVFRNYLSQKAIGTEFRVVSSLWSQRDGSRGVTFRFGLRSDNSYPLTLGLPDPDASPVD